MVTLVGITCTYFLTYLEGNTKSIEVTTANLVVDYGEEINELNNVTS